MDSELAIINTDFGTKQLSGNVELFKRLLLRFADEYQQSEQKLSEFQRQHNLEEMQIHVHTIKGVSGNLGLDKMHSVARHVDGQLKLQIGEVDLADLFSALNETIAQIQQYAGETDSNSSTSNASPEREKLIQALRQQMFVSDSDLDEFFTNSGHNQAQQQEIRSAIDDLDYPKALELLDGE